MAGSQRARALLINVVEIREQYPGSLANRGIKMFCEKNNPGALGGMNSPICGLLLHLSTFHYFKCILSHIPKAETNELQIRHSGIKDKHISACMRQKEVVCTLSDMHVPARTFQHHEFTLRGR